MAAKPPKRISPTTRRSRKLDLASQSTKSTAKHAKKKTEPALSTPLVSGETPPAIVCDSAKPADVLRPETSAEGGAISVGGQSQCAPKYFGSAPERIYDSRPPSPAKVKKYMDKMERNGWKFSFNPGGSKSITNLAYATMSDSEGELLKQLSSGQVLDCARRLLPMAKVAECAGIVASFDFEPSTIDSGEDEQTDLKAAKTAVSEAKDLLEMLALHKNGFDDEARRIEETLDFRKAAEQLVDGLEFANCGLRSMEAEKTVFSSVMRKEIPAVCDIGACNVYNFLALADGPITLKYLCKWWEWNIQTITDDYGGEILYVITNDDWSYVAGFVDLEAAKTHYMAKALVPSRERIEDMIDKGIQPPVPPVPPPPRAPTEDDDIPF